MMDSDSKKARLEYLNRMILEQGADKDTLHFFGLDKPAEPMSKPIYQELSKIPLMEQLKSVKDQNLINIEKIKKDPSLGVEPSDDAKLKQFELNLFLEQLKQGQGLA